MAAPADDEDRTLSEATPLLTGGGGGGGSGSTAAEVPEAGKDEVDPRDLVRTRAVVLCFAIVFLFETCFGLCAPAWNALLEANICRELNPGIAEDLLGRLVAGGGGGGGPCKSPAVQGKLAMIRGWTLTLDCIPGLLFSVPFGMLSDRWGRRPVMFLAFLGMILSIAWMLLSLAAGWPSWVYLLECVFQSIGGTTITGVAQLFTVLADVVHADAMASVLFRFGSVLLVAELISTPLSGYLLSISPWCPPLVGLTLFVILLVAVILLPETLVVRQWHDARTGNGRAASPGGGAVDGADADGSPGKPDRSGLAGLAAVLRSTAEDVARFILGNRRLAVLMMPLIFVTLGKYVQELLLQYATKRYHWSWSTATYALTLKALSLIAMYIVILPAISKFCLDYLKMTPLAKDVWLSRWSGLLLILGALLLAFAFNPVLFALGLVVLSSGWGFSFLIRSLLNTLVEPHHVGILNTLLGFLETVGALAASPALAAAMRLGINLGGPWIGMPFMVAALFFAVATVIVWLFRLPPREEQEGLDD